MNVGQVKLHSQSLLSKDETWGGAIIRLNPTFFDSIIEITCSYIGVYHSAYRVTHMDFFRRQRSQSHSMQLTASSNYTADILHNLHDSTILFPYAAMHESRFGLGSEDLEPTNLNTPDDRNDAQKTSLERAMSELRMSDV